ncbi:hypothetical protein JCM19232_1962 [Vibrio ishigakensis]|uniref:Uncharacterized protein n=1 Tax=Vibrio ishigakensis TaxID=1481914 RepID=A0A0B8P7H2_9VIBR|nr:hypothetical protein JCM19232_1962 [Vibrio ishigakensis]
MSFILPKWSLPKNVKAISSTRAGGFHKVTLPASTWECMSLMMQVLCRRIETICKL